MVNPNVAFIVGKQGNNQVLDFFQVLLFDFSRVPYIHVTATATHHLIETVIDRVAIQPLQRFKDFNRDLASEHRPSSTMYTIARKLAGLEHDDLPVELNIPAAIDLFQRCIDEQNHIRAMFDLAEVLGMESNDHKTLLRQFTLYERFFFSSGAGELHFLKLLYGKCYSTLEPNLFSRIVRLYECYIERTGDRQVMMALARILVKGNPGVERDLSRALQLLDNCVDEAGKNNAAMTEIVNVIFTEADGNEGSIDRALDIFKTHFDGGNYERASDYLFQRISALRRKPHFPASAPFVIRLLETYIEIWNNPTAMTNLAEVLLFELPPAERDIDRGLELWASAIDVDNMFNSVLIRNLLNTFYESWWTSENASVIAPLCELCIEKGGNDQPMVYLAEILMTGGAGIKKDVGRALQLCDKSLDTSTCCRGVTNLAKKVAEGRCGIPRNVQIAAQLCEMCIEKRNDGMAMMLLAEIFISGAPGIERDIGRSIDLCKNYMRIGRKVTQSWYDVPTLAAMVVDGAYDVPRALDVAMQLCKACVEEDTDIEATERCVIELLLTKCPDSRNGIGRGVKMCKIYLGENGSSNWVADLAKHIAQRRSFTTGDVQLAIQLCELCINRRNGRSAKFVLAEILITGAVGVEKDVDRGLELCEKYLSQGGQTKALTDLARNVAFGICGKRRDVGLAIKLCEMCIAKNGDADAMVLLAEILGCGHSDVVKDIDRAIKLWRLSLHRRSDVFAAANAMRDMAFGRGHTTKNVSLAIEFCEKFISEGDKRALTALAEILFLERSGNKDIRRGVQLCQESLNIENYENGIHEVATLARRLLIVGKRGAEGNAQLALQLVEMFMAAWEKWEASRLQQVKEKVLVAAAEVLIAATTDSKNIERAVHLCDVAIDRTRSGGMDVSKAARNIAFGINRMTRDTALAIRLCKMCIEKRAAHGFASLAAIHIAGTPELEKNVSYALELCEQSITENRHRNLVPCLARSITAGTEWLAGDAALAVKLCEMCVEKRRDVRAMVVLSEIYSTGGCGVEMDVGRAHEWYEHAVDEGWLLFNYDYDGSIKYFNNFPTEFSLVGEDVYYYGTYEPRA